MTGFATAFLIFFAGVRADAILFPSFVDAPAMFVDLDKLAAPVAAGV